MGIKISFITSLFRGTRYLEQFFESVLRIEGNIEIVLIHNQPLAEELHIIKRYMERTNVIRHIVVPREGVYSSWNRAIDHAGGEYLAMWNIDDIRTNAGVQAQLKFLDANPHISIVSGDYTKTFRFADTKGTLKRDPVKKDLLGIYKFNNGCFLMWRKTIHGEIGYFDEQFKVAGDWEFWMRATRSFQAGRVDAMLGYYLRESNSGLSKTAFVDEALEDYVIKTRFYRFYIINIYKIVFRGKKLRVHEILNFGKFQRLKTKVPFNAPSRLASLLFFWTVPLMKAAVELRFYILKQKQKQAVYE